MSAAPVDRERQLQRVMYAVIHGDAGGEPEVLIAKDEESLNQTVALELIATTAPHRVGIHLAEIRDALMDGRWADALVAWMSATGRIVDVYPDEPVRSSVLDEETIELELKLKPIFGDPDS